MLVQHSTRTWNFKQFKIRACSSCNSQIVCHDYSILRVRRNGGFSRAIPMIDHSQLAKDRLELRQAIRDCADRRLHEAAKWAALQLSGMPPDPASSDPPSACSEPAFATVEEEDAYRLGAAHFDFREYSSAALVLQPFWNRANVSSKTRFLHLYCALLHREKEQAEKRAQPAGLVAYANRSEEILDGIESSILRLGPDGTDGFLLYILGLVYLDKEDKPNARKALAMSVTHYPCNWLAWKSLQTACPDLESASSLSLPDHFMTQFFKASLFVDLQRSSDALTALSVLAERFPSSDALLQGAAMAQNNLHNYEEAQQLFEELLKKDPFRIDGMDVYSNILYVKEDSASLAGLARRCVEQDRYRPDSCCIVGNYYSLRGEHEKAVVYFRRALKLDPNYLPAWTLMGHEFVELKNPPGAIDAYQRAVSINPRDYRAWYGLGQTYELVNMPYYALYYYRRAVCLRPEDGRMWNAMAHCYASPALGQTEAAIRCYRRAMPHDKEGVAMRQLAALHAALGQKKEAAHYYNLNLQRVEGEGQSTGQDAVDALTFLGQYHRDVGEYEISQEYYTRLLDYGLPQQRELAKESLRQIQAVLAAQAVTPGRLSTPGSMDLGMTPPPPR